MFRKRTASGVCFGVFFCRKGGLQIIFAVRRVLIIDGVFFSVILTLTLSAPVFHS